MSLIGLLIGFTFLESQKPYKIKGFRKLLTGIGLYLVPESLQNQGGTHTVYKVSTVLLQL